MQRTAVLALAPFFFAAGLAACANLLGIDEGSGRSDTSNPSDGAPSNDADTPDGSAVEPTYFPIGATDKWEKQFLPDAVTSAVIVAGNYVYFIPFSDAGTTFWRYERTKPFDAVEAWTSFTPAKTQGVLYSSGVYDGERYLYLTPYRQAGRSLGSGLVARFDTQQSFTTESAWQTAAFTEVVG